MKKRSFAQDVCPVARALDVVGDWWSLLIMRDALTGIRRFTDFQRSLGLAKNILSSRLKTLVEHGLLEAAPAENSVHSVYLPTKRGEALLPVLVALGQWGKDHLFLSDEACSFSVAPFSARLGMNEKIQPKARPRRKPRPHVEG